ncbi:MAG: aldose epimerase family protein [Myxococcota bacterium]|nr:aldose epimerase family protein [Myxococcota bacterium]
MDRAAFRRRLERRHVDLFHLENGAGIEAWITNYGGIVVSLLVPDRDGKRADVVLGCDSLDGYLAGHPHFGAICGRCANRIGNARFSIDGEVYSLAANRPPNHLHGGDRGWDKVVWDAEQREARLELHYSSPDGEEGYPGKVEASVVYHLNDTGLGISFSATTTAPTVVNLTHHGYFNLAGHARGSVLDHELQSPATAFCATDATSIPLGDEQPVDGTPFDFRTAKLLGREIDADDEQLSLAGGYDHHLVVGSRSAEPRLAARLRHPGSGRACELWTTEPGFQLYTGNALDGSVEGKGGCTYPKRSGVCLEPQLHPDAVNQPGFPSPLLRPGDRYQQLSEYRFSVD